ncbi:MAG: hypothetical protein AAF652_01340 [Cyanobacteria bacterium P01_C01_bin.72]
MSILVVCPCCNNTLLHHFSDRREYWFCRQCWQEMPDLHNLKLSPQRLEKKAVNLPISLVKRKISV